MVALDHSSNPAKPRGEASSPVVSVVMTSYKDDAQRLKTAVDSIFGQTFADLELLIAFEPGDANAEALERTYPGGKLVVLRNPERYGKARSFNYCLARARGRYVARMDSDDRAFPDRIEKQLAFLQNHEDIAIVGGGTLIVDVNGRVIATRLFATDHRAIVRNFALMNAMSHPTVLWDRRKVGENVAYDPNFSVEDLELWFRLLHRGLRFANLPEPVIEYKQTEEWRRTMQNWRGNLRVRVSYWRLALRYPRLLLGIFAYAVLVLLPKPVIDRLTQRGRITDFIRSIRPTDASSTMPR
jgi:glycosyltransferase involved in cell wall biosynthesis